MTDLSVIIVSYNVRAFLEQCLVSVERAKEGVSMDVWVVDNRSVDGSVDMVQSRFPWVHVVANEDNVGFAVANNQAIAQCQGKHVLLLNPDTVVREDSFKRCLAHAEAHPKLGGMGVPMFDGTGRYLPESKRGLPTPWAAFCRMSGLHRLAPKSRAFNAYYAGHVATEETATIDILSGAYMWMRKEALDDVGLLDEQFFMYGEDIDLSWRLVQGGWENHYFAGTSIIHYKGESTKKGSLNYVLIFYRAMLLFAAKHFEGGQAKAFSWMIRTAIYGRAALAIFRRLLARWRHALGVLIWTAATMVPFALMWDKWWEKSLRWPDTAWLLAGLLGTQMLATWALGGYRPRQERTTLSGHVVAWMTASLLTLVMYSLWPESWRFSRALVVMLVLVHGAVHAAVSHNNAKRSGNPFFIRRLLVAGADLEGMVELLRRNEGVGMRLHTVAIWAGKEEGLERPNIQGIPWVGVPRDIAEAIQIHNLDEVVFSGRDVRTDTIVEALPMLGRRRVKCRIAWTDVGDVMSSGGATRESFVAFQRGLHLPEVARTKRSFDVVFSAAVILATPGLLVARRSSWIAMAWRVLIGRCTWVSPGNLKTDKPHLFDAYQGMQGRGADRKAFTHAQDYHWRKDLAVVVDALISHRAIISHGHH